MYRLEKLGVPGVIISLPDLAVEIVKEAKPGPPKKIKSHIDLFVERYKTYDNTGMDRFSRSFIERNWDDISPFTHGLGEIHIDYESQMASHYQPELKETIFFSYVLPVFSEAELDGHIKEMGECYKELYGLAQYVVDREEIINDTEGFGHTVSPYLNPARISKTKRLIELLYIIRDFSSFESFTALLDFADNIKSNLSLEQLKICIPLIRIYLKIGLSLDEVFYYLDALVQKDTTAQHIQNMINRCNYLSDNELLPLPALVASGLNADELRNEIKVIGDGGFKIDNPVHVDLNYLMLREEILRLRELSPRESYAEFVKFINKIRRGSYKQGELAVSQEHQIQIRGMVYEAYLLRKKILSLQEAARRMGKEVVVIENLSYGAVVTSPITYERNGDKFIEGTDIPVWGTKIGSTESHNNENVMRSDLFSQERMRYLLEKQPIVVIVDASTSVASPERTSPHIPDAFKGYRNHFLAINTALGIESDLNDFLVDAEFMDSLEKVSAFEKVVKQNKNPAAGKLPYKFYFYYPGNKALYLRHAKKVEKFAPKLLDDSALKGPAVIFIQAAIEPEAVPRNIRSGFINGQHDPAYFDDRDHYKQFYLDYEEGYGIHLSRSYIVRSRQAYSELLQFLGEKGEEMPSIALSSKFDREIDTVVLDLDNTLEETDELLSSRAIVIIKTLLEKGKRVIIATEDIEQNVDKRLKKLLEKVFEEKPDALKNLWLATDGGTTAYRFLSPTRKGRVDEYNTSSFINAQERGQVLSLLEENFSRQYALDQRKNRISPERRIDLRNVKDRNEFIAKLSSVFSLRGFDYQVYKAGGTSVKITKKHKAGAVRYLINAFNLQENKILIIADAAKTHQIDRQLLSEFGNSVSINVGKASRSIGKINPNIIQTEAGIKGTFDILENLIQFDKLLMRPLLPYQALNQKDATSYELAVEAQVSSADEPAPTSSVLIGAVSSQINSSL